MDRGVGSLGGVKSERKQSTRLDEYVPPILSAEQAEATLALKPFLKAVADVNRLAILQELARQDGLSVLDLSDRLVLSQPLTSWHLHILKRARLVSPTHVGRQRIYRLNRDRLQEYRELFNWLIDL
ncbi:MAG: metalloregulator ArsR/SmtB family transcription factor [Chloroflexia bacterium]